MVRTQAALDTLLGSLPGGIVFRDEQSAAKWVTQVSAQLYAHKLANAQLDTDDREQLDSIEAGYVHAKDLGTRARQQRLPWLDKLLDAIADGCFCQLVPLSGTLSAWLIGRRADRRVAMHLMGSLVPTVERLAQDAYLAEYHTQRRAGNVEAARGFKDTYFDAFITHIVDAFRQQLAHAEQQDGARDVLSGARQDVVAYMNENFLPTKGSRNVRLA